MAQSQTAWSGHAADTLLVHKVARAADAINFKNGEVVGAFNDLNSVAGSAIRAVQT